MLCIVALMVGVEGEWMWMWMKNLYSANSLGRIWGAGVWMTRGDKQKQKGKI